ncbi:hypothetical protein B2J93_1022 [Marssonina coronariae]|uniref:Uncharacterized protein n=1 Tax=Diplocarpon coronariae TaxID=2795749 RepID=A0A218Z3G6_9HELO|nr:hypothetical protein B2J93_1022 [Marssonina coronariae]
MKLHARRRQTIAADQFGCQRALTYRAQETRGYRERTGYLTPVSQRCSSGAAVVQPPLIRSSAAVGDLIWLELKKGLREIRGLFRAVQRGAAQSSAGGVQRECRTAKR